MKVSFENEFNGEFVGEGKIDLFYEIMSDVVVYVISQTKVEVEVIENNVTDNGDVDVEENRRGNYNGDVDMRMARKKEANRAIQHMFGTGVVIKPGLVLTAAHVVKDAVGVTIRYLEDTYYYACDVIKFDEQLDLALIKKRSSVGSKKHVKFGCSDDVRIGGQVLTIAHSGIFEYSFTMGNIVHPHRCTNADAQNATYPFIQINNMNNKKGSSGGPVFNPAGLLIGINVFGSDEYDFATHIDFVKDFVKDFVEDANENPLELEIQRVQRRSNAGFIARKKKNLKKLAKRVPKQRGLKHRTLVRSS